MYHHQPQTDMLEGRTTTINKQEEENDEAFNILRLIMSRGRSQFPSSMVLGVLQNSFCCIFILRVRPLTWKLVLWVRAKCAMRFEINKYDLSCLFLNSYLVQLLPVVVVLLHTCYVLRSNVKNKNGVHGVSTQHTVPY
jgi:hypothetical protein